MSSFDTVLSMLLAFVYWLLIALVTLRILMKRRAVSSSMAWLLIIYIIPLFGVIAYGLFGELHLGKKRAEYVKKRWPLALAWLSELKKTKDIFCTTTTPLSDPLFQLCERIQGVPATRDNQLQVITSTEETLKSLIHDVNNAKATIDIVFYIWNCGGLADDFAEAVMAASQRGVRCRVMLDSAGSFRFFYTPLAKRMRDAGIELIEVLKVNIFRMFLRRMDLRQHRKMVIIDTHIAYLGSMNMVDPRYFKQDYGVGQWIDLMIRISGPVSLIMEVIYTSDWGNETGEHITPPIPESLPSYPVEETGHTVHIIPSGPGYPEDMILQVLLTAVYSARKELVMVTPYFVPSDDLLRAICTAALRGVKVSLIVPAKSDSLMVGWASRAFYSELLAAGVKIYKFKDGLLHTKCITVDGQLNLIGSVNLDNRSLWLNFEITAVIDDAELGQQMTMIQREYIEGSKPLSIFEWQKRSLLHRIIERLFYFFSPLL